MKRIRLKLMNIEENKVKFIKQPSSNMVKLTNFWKIIITIIIITN